MTTILFSPDRFSLRIQLDGIKRLNEVTLAVLSRSRSITVRIVSVLLFAGIAQAALANSNLVNISTRLEPFFDDYLVATVHNVSLVLGTPENNGTVLSFDEPYEGNFACYVTVLKDEQKYRMYYRGQSTDKSPSVTCYAESNDGRKWVKPRLGLNAYQGRKDTNIIMVGDGTGNFCPFIDANPMVKPEEKFKAVGGSARTGLYAFASVDGVNWHRLYDRPVFTEGAFDSQNVPFWSDAEGCYVLYFRVWSEGDFNGIRTISRTTSKDFIHWSRPERMTFGDTPMEHLYTNQTHPYYRAPHIYLAFSMRLMPERQLLSAEEARSLGVFPDRERHVSDTIFMTSRGGTAYQRTFMSAYFRPGLDRKMWVARNSIVALGVVPLEKGRMGLYRQHHYASPTNHLVLYSMREDGIASLHAGAEAGFVVTKPFKHTGTGLWLNYATSAVGTVAVEVLDADGNGLTGFSGEQASRFFGDSLEEEVKWSAGRSWAQLAGKVVQLRISLHDADLYSIQQR
jgi:hypothetical protein